jgi:hypothetical protein
MNRVIRQRYLEKYAAKRKLALSLKENLLLSGLIGGGLGALRGRQDDTVLSSALKGVGGMTLGALLAQPIEQIAARTPNLAKKLPLLAASTAIGVTPYILAQRLGRARRGEHEGSK